jgi:hypothetical protein
MTDSESASESNAGGDSSLAQPAFLHLAEVTTPLSAIAPPPVPTVHFSLPSTLLISDMTQPELEWDGRTREYSDTDREFDEFDDYVEHTA